MNLKFTHILTMIPGGIVGLALGWMLSFLLKPGLFPLAEDVIGRQGIGLLFGAIAGMGISLLIIINKAARDSNAEVANNFTLLNGSGSSLMGCKDINPDGSYIATEWFFLFYIPIFPVCRYRVILHEGSNSISKQYTILEKLPPRYAEAIKVYLIAAVILSAVIGIFIWLENFRKSLQ